MNLTEKQEATLRGRIALILGKELEPEYAIDEIIQEVKDMKTEEEAQNS